MYLFRLHIRPGGGSASMAETFAYCLSQRVLGVGWRTERNQSTNDWDEYLREALPVHGKVNTCAYLRQWVTPGSLIWTRDVAARYYLAQVISGWEYLTTPESAQRDIDIANVVRCDIREIALDEVPGKVVACFRAPRTLQEIQSATALEYSKFLWNRVTGVKHYEIDPKLTANPDIFALLDAEETEDLVFLFLQQQGWLVIPNSRRADTMAFEYTVLRAKPNEQADVQVKTGNSVLRPDTYRDHPRPVILFQSNDRYEGPNQPHVTCLTRQALLDFFTEASSWLPARYRHKSEMLRGHA